MGILKKSLKPLKIGVSQNKDCNIGISMVKTYYTITGISHLEKQGKSHFHNG